MIDWIRQRLHLPERPPARPLPLDHQQSGGKASQHQIMEQNVANYLAHIRTLGDELPPRALHDQNALKKAVSQGQAHRREWNQPTTLVAPTPFPRSLVTSLKA